ncbi:MAG TPA: hypothetical protein VF175_03390 [Lacipirellula sp.]
MRFSSALTSFVFLLAVGSSACVFATDAAKPASGEEKYLLRYKFAMGEVLRYDVRHATNMRTTIDESTQQALTRSDSVKSWRVTDVLPSGEMEFVHVVEWVKMSNETPDQPKREFDSRKDARPPRGFEQAAGAVGVPLSVVRIAGDGEVTFREEKHPQPKASEDMPITLQLPKERVAVGDKWSHPYDVKVKRKSGAQMEVRTRRVCELRDVKHGVAVIDVEYQILTPVESYVRAQLVERLTKGTVRFDIERGRILEQEHNADCRVLGFASKASSMHYVARLSEELIKEDPNAGKIQQASANLPQ